MSFKRSLAGEGGAVSPSDVLATPKHLMTINTRLVKTTHNKGNYFAVTKMNNL